VAVRCDSGDLGVDEVGVCGAVFGVVGVGECDCDSSEFGVETDSGTGTGSGRDVSVDGVGGMAESVGGGDEGVADEDEGDDGGELTVTVS